MAKNVNAVGIIRFTLANRRGIRLLAKDAWKRWLRLRKDKMQIPITLKNTSDLVLFRVGGLQEVREISLEAIVKKDWKCRLVISKKLQKLLGLPTKVAKTVFFDENKEYYVEMAEALELQVKNRWTTICPFVMSNLQTAVIGLVLLGELNLEIDSIQNSLAFLDKKLRV